MIILFYSRHSHHSRTTIITLISFRSKLKLSVLLTLKIMMGIWWVYHVLHARTKDNFCTNHLHVNPCVCTCFLAFFTMKLTCKKAYCPEIHHNLVQQQRYGLKLLCVPPPTPFFTAILCFLSFLICPLILLLASITQSKTKQERTKW